MGKTFIGLRLAEHAQEEGHNVLVVVPKSVKDNWLGEIKRYFPTINTSEDKLKIMTITELSNKDLSTPQGEDELDRLKNCYDFIVIDEAHRFRNHGEFDYDERKYTGIKRYANLSHLKTENTKYVLLTATPINNSIMDLEHLITIFATKTMLKNYDPNLNLGCFKEYGAINKKLQDLKRGVNLSNMTEDEIEQEINKKEDECKIKLDEIRKIIHEVMVLRTKQNIMENYSDNRIGGKAIITDIPQVRKSDYEPGSKYAGII